MYPMTILEWWHNGAWNEIGWRATCPRSTDDLREHAAKMAMDGGWYRLIRPSVFRDGPPDVIWRSHPQVPA